MDRPVDQSGLRKRRWEAEEGVEEQGGSPARVTTKAALLGSPGVFEWGSVDTLTASEDEHASEAGGQRALAARPLLLLEGGEVPQHGRGAGWRHRRRRIARRSP